MYVNRRPYDPLPVFTPPRLLKGDRLPVMRTMEDFELVHLNDDYRKKNYLNSPRSNYYRPSLSVWDALWPRRIPELIAIEVHERIRFAKIALSHIEAHPGFWHEHVFWVTIISDRYVCPLADGADFDIKPLKAYVRQALTGLDFIGGIDVGLFKNDQRLPLYPSDLLSWHSHNLVWGASRAEIEACVKDARTKTTLLPGGASVHVMRISREKLIEKALYMLKGPQKEYHVRRDERRERELFHMTGATEQIYKLTSRPLRTGDRVRMSEVMCDRLLNDMIFGGGEGTALVRAINDEALLPFRRDEERRSIRY